MDWEWNVAFSKYTKSFREARKLLDRSFRPTAIATFRPQLQMKTHVLLTEMLRNPDELDAHVHQFVASIPLAPHRFPEQCYNYPAC